MAQLIIKNGAQDGTVFHLKPGINRIGRHPDNDIVLEDLSVSLFHAEISVSEIAVSVRDLVSTNGCYLNQQRLLKGVAAAGSRLRMGLIEMEIQIEAAHIAIPQMEAVALPEPAWLDDGFPACFIHRVVPAALFCQKCGHTFCDECVRRVGLAGKTSKIFCPECSGPCEPLAHTPPPVQSNQLLNTVKILRTTISNAFRPRRPK
jgi:hypothetical protein